MTEVLFRMVYFTLLKIFKTGPVALTAFHSMAKTQPFPTLPLLGVKLTVHILLLLKVWMCGAIPPLLQMPSGCVKGKCTLFLLSLWFKQLKLRWAAMLQPDSSVPVQYSTQTSPSTERPLWTPHTNKQHSKSPAVPPSTPRLYYRLYCCFI